MSCRMFTARKKIVKEKDAPIDAFEEQVAQVGTAFFSSDLNSKY